MYSCINARWQEQVINNWIILYNINTQQPTLTTKKKLIKLLEETVVVLLLYSHSPTNNSYSSCFCCSCSSSCIIRIWWLLSVVSQPKSQFRNMDHIWRLQTEIWWPKAPMFQWKRNYHYWASDYLPRPRSNHQIFLYCIFFFTLTYTCWFSLMYTFIHAVMICLAVKKMEKERKQRIILPFNSLILWKITFSFLSINSSVQTNPKFHWEKNC